VYRHVHACTDMYSHVKSRGTPTKTPQKSTFSTPTITPKKYRFSRSFHYQGHMARERVLTWTLLGTLGALKLHTSSNQMFLPKRHDHGVAKYFIEPLCSEDSVYTFIHFTCTAVIAVLKRHFTTMSWIMRNERHRRHQTPRLSGCKVLAKNFYICASYVKGC
jgi:hypothetical protein